jgi:hypothetical protein
MPHGFGDERFLWPLGSRQRYSYDFSRLQMMDRPPSTITSAPPRCPDPSHGRDIPVGSTALDKPFNVSTRENRINRPYMYDKNIF